jgi:thymidine phosphorylase
MANSKAYRSLKHLHAKISGERLGANAFARIIADIDNNNYEPVHIATFLTACAAQELDEDEIYALTKAMVQSGQKLTWERNPVVDKHCVGGLPGNRTTPIIVAIVAAAGLTIPKTSSRAITSASGTADTMEVIAPVDLSTDQMRQVVEQEGGCVVWGGNVGLSPVDDDLVRIARKLEFDGTGQLVSSVLSKKIAAGATHAVIDIPIGPTAKIQDLDEANRLGDLLRITAKNFGLSIDVQLSDGVQPVGYGIGPALEARDIVNVLQNTDKAPMDLKVRALTLAGSLLEIGGKAKCNEGLAIAQGYLRSGAAWRKFQAICEAQGGYREIPTARHTHTVQAQRSGQVAKINNFSITRLAKAAGAPEEKAAGLDLHVSIGDEIYPGQPIFTVHTQSKSLIDKALGMNEVEEPAVEFVYKDEKIRSYV